MQRAMLRHRAAGAAHLQTALWPLLHELHATGRAPLLPSTSSRPAAASRGMATRRGKQQQQRATMAGVVNAAMQAGTTASLQQLPPPEVLASLPTVFTGQVRPTRTWNPGLGAVCCEGTQRSQDGHRLCGTGTHRGRRAGARHGRGS
jgi:hypothetical protein